MGRTPPCTTGCHKSRPCTLEMNQPSPSSCTRGPVAAPASDPPRPTAQPTDTPASREPTQCCTHVPAIPAPGPAYLQLQDQVHPVLAEGADVVEDEGCDDVDPVGLVGHDAALGQQCSGVIPRVLPSLPSFTSNTAQVQSSTLLSALTHHFCSRSPRSLLSLAVAPFPSPYYFLHHRII